MPMLKYAGLGVAMGNAVEVTKKIADKVTTDCDHERDNLKQQCLCFWHSQRLHDHSPHHK